MEILGQFSVEINTNVLSVPARWASKLKISAKQARSIKHQLITGKLPLAKDVDDCAFAGTPINEALIRDLTAGAFLVQQRNVVLGGGTGTGKRHLAIARSYIHAGSRERFFTTVVLVNQLEAQPRARRQGCIADYLTRLNFVILDDTVISHLTKLAASCFSISSAGFTSARPSS